MNRALQLARSAQKMAGQLPVSAETVAGDPTSIGSIVKGAIITRLVGYAMIASCLVLLAWGAYRVFRRYFPQLTPNSRNVGEACKESFECIGYKTGSGPACCGRDPNNKTCTQKVQTSLGTWFCPEEAHLGIKKPGDACVESSECAGYTFGSGRPGIDCCKDPADGKKKCIAKVQDYAKGWFCPAEAVKSPGTVASGGYCKESSECVGYALGKGAGNVDCCKNKCTPLVKDLTGNWYCPGVATGQKEIGDSCKESFECRGYKAGSGPACCGPVGAKKCTQKKKDWLHVWYCPEECVGKAFGKKGTC